MQRGIQCSVKNYVNFESFHQVRTSERYFAHASDGKLFEKTRNVGHYPLILRGVNEGYITGAFHGCRYEEKKSCDAYTAQ